MGDARGVYMSGHVCCQLFFGVLGLSSLAFYSGAYSQDKLKYISTCEFK